MDRRSFIKTAGAATAGIAFAGCMGEEGPGVDGGTEPATTDTGTAQQTATGTEGGTPAADLEGEVGATPDNLELVSHEAYESGEEVGVRGEVRNVGDVPYEFVEVEVTLRDGDTVIGEFVDTSEEDLDSLPPGETWSFKVVFEDEELSAGTGYTIEIEGDLADDGTPANGDLEGTVGDVVDGLEVVSHDVFETDGDVGVEGTIENVGDTAYAEVEAEVTLLDGDTVIGEFVDTTEAETETLPPGETWSFEVFFDDEELTAATDYSVSVDGETA